VERREASAPEADGPCKRIFRGARRARSANGWQQPLAWRGHFSLRLPALRLPSFYVEAKQQWLSFLLQNSGADASRERSPSPSPAGGGSRPEGTRGGVRGDAGSSSALRALSPQPAALCASTFPLQGKVRRKSPLARGRMREKGTCRAQTQRARAHIAKISRSLLRRRNVCRACLLRLFRLLARLPLSAVPPRPRLSWRLHRLHPRPPRRRVRSVRRGQSPCAGARPERCRRAGAPRLAERILHRDLGKVA
jgi:hypothetical protein